MSFATRYGPWGLVAGASEGLGLAFAEALAERGLDLFLVARRRAVLEERAAALRRRHGIDVHTRALDLSSAEAVTDLAGELRDLGVGLMVYNAAHSSPGRFSDRKLEDHLKILDTNCRTPLVLAHALLPRLQARGRGGLLFMSSIAGLQGTAFLAGYAASKAYTRILAEGLWREASRDGVDVLACCAGAIRTPGYAASLEGRSGPPAILVADPARVAAAALDALGSGPRNVPSLLDRIFVLLSERLLPRRLSVALMSRSTERLYDRS